jgi:hypothetical protein
MRLCLLTLAALAEGVALSVGSVRRGTMLCDVPSPTLLLDCSTARQREGLDGAALDAALASGVLAQLTDLVYVHTRVMRGRDPSAGAVGSTTRSGTDVPVEVELAVLDATAEQCGEEAYVGLGMNNHYTGGYYWGRSSGPGAAMEAPGMRLVADDAGALRLLRVGNSNDGKRSEWCEFLRRGDTLQLVVAPSRLSAFDMLIGVCRDGDRGVPKGAEPIVEAVWARDAADGGWIRQDNTATM